MPKEYDLSRSLREGIGRVDRERRKDTPGCPAARGAGAAPDKRSHNRSGLAIAHAWRKHRPSTSTPGCRLGDSHSSTARTCEPSDCLPASGTFGFRGASDGTGFRAASATSQLWWQYGPLARVNRPRPRSVPPAGLIRQQFQQPVGARNSCNGSPL